MARKLPARNAGKALPSSRGGLGTRNVLFNTVVLTTGQLLGRVSGLIFVPFIARQLGSGDLGAYQLSNILIAYLSVAVLFGLSPLVVRSMAQHPEDAPRLFAESLSLRVLFAGIAIGVLAIFLFLSGYPRIVNEMSLILSLGLFALAVTDAADTVFQAHQQMGYSVLVTLTSTAVYLVTGSIALHSGYGVVGLAAASCFAALVRTVLALGILRSRFFAPRLTWVWSEQRTLLYSAVPFFLGGASAYILSKVDVLMLSRTVPLEVLGLYVAGYFFLDISLFLPNSFAQAIYPELARIAGERRAQLGTLTQRFYKLIFAAGLLNIVTVVPIAAWLVHLLYGAKYESSVAVLQIVIWSVVLVSFNATVGRAIYAAGGQWPLVWISLIGAASNVIGNLVLIPHLGIIGSSITTVASFGVGVCCHAYFARRYQCSINPIPLLRAIPGLIVGLVVGIVAFQLSWWVGLVGAACTYLAGLVLMGYFSSAEMASVVNHLSFVAARFKEALPVSPDE
ncbi:MAG: flippase [Chloroflexi bacterium]|nr:flippase [Chloroflexota bacterium]